MMVWWQITGSLADPEPASLLSRYLDHLLDGIARRKTSKLLAHRDPVDERHLFIWITESSPMDIAAMLRDVPEDLQSHVAPNLPEGITNLWMPGRICRCTPLNGRRIEGGSIGAGHRATRRKQWSGRTHPPG